jgi:hypothetical protein
MEVTFLSTYIHGARVGAVPAKEKAPQRPTIREERINLRVSVDLYRAAYEKALQYGGLSAVIRAMLRKFVSGTINFELEDLADENRRAKKSPSNN